MTNKQKIEVQVGTEGVPQAIAALRALRSSVANVSGNFSGLKESVASSVAGLRSIAAGLGGVGIAAAGLTGASVAGLIAGLEKSKDIARQVADELNTLDRIAVASSTKSADLIGGLAFAFESLGGVESGEGVSEVEAIGGAIVASLVDLKDGSESAVAAYEKLGAYYEDFFSDSGSIRGFDEIFINLGERVKSVKDQQNLLETLIPVVGEADAGKLIRLLSAGGDEIARQIGLYRRLTGMRDSDVASAKRYADALKTSTAAATGIRIAFSRDLIPALTETEAQFQGFAVKNHERFQAFGGLIGGIISRLQPLLLETADTILAIIAGDGDMIADSPLKAFAEGALAALEGLAQALEDVLRYLQTGETDAAWLKSTIDFLSSARDTISSIYETISVDIIPIVRDAIDGISSLLDALGVEGGGAQFAITAGLAIFGNTLTGIVASITALVASLGLVAPAVAGALASLPALGAGALILDAQDMDRQAKIAAEQTRRFEDEKGAAFAASYLRAFINHVPREFATAPLLTGLEEKLTALDIQIVGSGDTQGAIDGAIAAFREFGWGVRESGQVEIGAGIFVDSAEFSGAVQGRLSSLEADLTISQISGLDSVLSDLKAAIDIEMSLNSDMNRSLGDGADGHDLASSIESVTRAEAEVERLRGEVERLRAQRPVTLQLPGGQSIGGLSATDDAIAAISRGISLSQRARS
jgi:hypothetical protein